MFTWECHPIIPLARSEGANCSARRDLRVSCACVILLFWLCSLRFTLSDLVTSILTLKSLLHEDHTQQDQAGTRQTQ